MNQSAQKIMKNNSPLSSMQIMQNSFNQKSNKKSLYFSMNLTTLIDAFCILVIFLLSNMNNSSEVAINQEKIKLPTARSTESIQQGTRIKIEDDKIYVNDELIKYNELTKKIANLLIEGKKSLIIQADKKTHYQQLAPIIRSGGQVGYENFIFAVLSGS